MSESNERRSVTLGFFETLAALLVIALLWAIGSDLERIADALARMAPRAEAKP